MNYSDNSDPWNPFKGKFICNFYLKNDVSKLQAFMALGKLMHISTNEARLFVKVCHRLSYMDSESFRQVVLDSGEVEIVKTALSDYFDLMFARAETNSYEFGNFGFNEKSEINS